MVRGGRRRRKINRESVAARNSSAAEVFLPAAFPETVMCGLSEIKDLRCASIELMIYGPRTRPPSQSLSLHFIFFSLPMSFVLRAGQKRKLNARATSFYLAICSTARTLSSCKPETRAKAIKAGANNILTVEGQGEQEAADNQCNFRARLSGLSKHFAKLI